jgi:hypothetical protein
VPEHKSGEEIERVFKVRQIPKNIEQYPSENIVQGYLAIDASGAEVRLRKMGERYFETFKGSGRLQSRELEIELSHDQFNPNSAVAVAAKSEEQTFHSEANGLVPLSGQHTAVLCLCSQLT